MKHGWLVCLGSFVLTTLSSADVTGVPAYITDAEAWLEKHPVPRRPFDEARHGLLDHLGADGLETRWRDRAAENPMYWILLAYHHSESRRPADEVLSLLEQAPQGMHRSFAQAYAYYQHGEDAKAQAYLQAAVKLAQRTEDRLSLWRTLGQAHWQAGRPEAARQVWVDAWNTHPDWQLRLAMSKDVANVQATQGQHDAFVRALEAGPKDVWPNALLLAAWYEHGRWPSKSEAAWQHLKEADQQRPEAMQVAFDLAAQRHAYLQRAEWAHGMPPSDSVMWALTYRHPDYTRASRQAVQDLLTDYLTKHREDIQRRPLRWLPWVSAHPTYQKILTETPGLESLFAQAEIGLTRQSLSKQVIIAHYWKIFREARDGTPLGSVAAAWEDVGAVPELRWRPLSKREAWRHQRSTSKVMSFESHFGRPRSTVRDWPEERIGNSHYLADEGHLRWIALQRLVGLLGRQQVLATLTAEQAPLDASIGIDWRFLVPIYLDDVNLLCQALVEAPPEARPMRGTVARACFRWLSNDLHKVTLPEKDRDVLLAYLVKLGDALWERHALGRFSLTEQLASCYEKLKLPEQATELLRKAENWGEEPLSNRLSLAWLRRKLDKLTESDRQLISEVWRYDALGDLFDRVPSLSDGAFDRDWERHFRRRMETSGPPAKPPVDDWLPLNTSLSSDLRALAGSSSKALEHLGKMEGSLGVHARLVALLDGWRGNDTEARWQQAAQFAATQPRVVQERMLPTQLLLLADMKRYEEVAALLEGAESQPGMAAVEKAVIAAQALVAIGKQDHARQIVRALEERGMDQSLRADLNMIYRALGENPVVAKRRQESVARVNASRKPPPPVEVATKAATPAEQAPIEDDPTPHAALFANPKALGEINGRSNLHPLLVSATQAKLTVTEANVQDYGTFYLRLGNSVSKWGERSKALQALEHFHAQLPEHLRDQDPCQTLRMRLHAELGNHEVAGAQYAQEAWQACQHPIWRWSRQWGQPLSPPLMRMMEAAQRGYLETALTAFQKQLGSQTPTASQDLWLFFAHALLKKPEAQALAERCMEEHSQPSAPCREAMLRVLQTRAEPTAELLAFAERLAIPTQSLEDRLGLAVVLLRQSPSKQAARSRLGALCEQVIPTEMALTDRLASTAAQVAITLHQHHWPELASPIIDALLASSGESPEWQQARDHLLHGLPTGQDPALLKTLADSALAAWPPESHGNERVGMPWNVGSLKILSTSLARHGLLTQLKSLSDIVAKAIDSSPLPSQDLKAWLASCQSYLAIRSGDWQPTQPVIWLEAPSLAAPRLQVRFGPVPTPTRQAQASVPFYPALPTPSGLTLHVETRDDPQQSWAPLGTSTLADSVDLPATWPALQAHVRANVIDPASGERRETPSIGRHPGKNSRPFTGWLPASTLADMPRPVSENSPALRFPCMATRQTFTWVSQPLLLKERQDFLLQGVLQSPLLRSNLVIEWLDGDQEVVRTESFYSSSRDGFANGLLIHKAIKAGDLGPHITHVRAQLRVGGAPAMSSVILESLTLTPSAPKPLPVGLRFVQSLKGEGRAMILSPDQQHLALSSKSAHGLTVRNLPKGINHAFPSKDTSGRIGAIAFLPETRLALTVLAGDELWRWEPEATDAHALQRLAIRRKDEFMHLSPNGKWLLRTPKQPKPGDTFSIYQLSPFKLHRTQAIPEESRAFVNFYRQGAAFSLHGSGGGPVYTTETGEALAPRERDEVVAYYHRYESSKHHPKAKRRIDYGREQIRLIDVSSGESLAALPWIHWHHSLSRNVLLLEDERTVLILTQDGLLFEWRPVIP